MRSEWGQGLRAAPGRGGGARGGLHALGGGLPAAGCNSLHNSLRCTDTEEDIVEWSGLWERSSKKRT